jgi:ribonuclease P protein component
MLPLKNRLKKKKEFQQVFEEGETLFSDFLITRKIRKQESQRFGFIVSKKVSPKAVVRNRVKRILREQVRLILPLMKESFDAVLIAKKEIVGKDSKEVGEELKKIFLKKRI